jgi:MFS superfamily sulfate permease-like transporter
MWISLPLELITLLAGAIVYTRTVPSKTRLGNAVLWVFVAAMAAVELYASFGPVPASAAAEAQTALFAYGLLALLAGLVDWARGTLRG